MSGVDTRSFSYALAPARRRAQHEVELATAELGACQQRLIAAQRDLQQRRDDYAALARRITPLAKGVIDPWRAMASSGHALSLAESIAQGEAELRQHEDAVQVAQAALQQARVSQEGFDAHHAQALEDFGIEMLRRQQVAIDQDWIARDHVLRIRALQANAQGSMHEPT